MSDPVQQDHDVRMKGFAQRSTVVDSLAWLDSHYSRLPEETVSLDEAFTRVLARSMNSPVDVPGFVRSMMDGFAVRAIDTSGASPYNRLPLSVQGESMPGRPFVGSVQSGWAVRIMTGSEVPEGADAVLPVELVQIDRTNDRIITQGEVSPGQHMGQIGEDVAVGTNVLPEGRVLRPQDIGLLASIGIGTVPVVRQPRVQIVVTGNELLPAGEIPHGSRIVDSNGPMLAALVRRDGGKPLHPGIVPDHPEAILEAIRSNVDVVLVSGGSSVGQEDHAPSLIREHGTLAIHGIAMRPSSPTGMGLVDDRLVFLLPGHPVSCLCAYDFFAGRAIRGLGGRSLDWPYRRVTALLRRKIVSTVGRLECLRVQLIDEGVEPLAIGGASLLSSTTRADGFVLIPPDSEGYPPNTDVEVFLYD